MLRLRATGTQPPCIPAHGHALVPFRARTSFSGTHQRAAAPRQRCQAGNGPDERSSGDPWKSPESSSSPEPGQQPSTSVPSFQVGINWYCYCVIGLVFITDFTPIGYLLKASAGSDGVSAGLWLAALQWCAFVGPTLWFIKEKGWDFKQTLRLQPASPGLVVASVAGGAVLWTVIAWALAAKSGVSFFNPTQGPAADLAQSSTLGGLVKAPSDAGQWAQLLATVAVSPAVAEELLFRGFFLTTVLQRLGRVDAVFVVGALFAVSHLDPQQFFGLSMLGFAAGGLAVTSGSVLPAAALHFGYNAAALVAGAVLVP